MVYIGVQAVDIHDEHGGILETYVDFPVFSHYGVFGGKPFGHCIVDADSQGIIAGIFQDSAYPVSVVAAAQGQQCGAQDRCCGGCLEKYFHVFVF